MQRTQLLAAALTGALALPASAATFDWANPVDGDFSVAGNWVQFHDPDNPDPITSPPPGSSDIARINNASGDRYIVTQDIASLSLVNLIVSGKADVVMDGKTLTHGVGLASGARPLIVAGVLNSNNAPTLTISNSSVALGVQDIYVGGSQLGDRAHAGRQATLEIYDSTLTGGRHFGALGGSSVKLVNTSFTHGTNVIYIGGGSTFELSGTSSVNGSGTLRMFASVLAGSDESAAATLTIDADPVAGAATLRRSAIEIGANAQDNNGRAVLNLKNGSLGTSGDNSSTRIGEIAGPNNQLGSVLNMSGGTFDTGRLIIGANAAGTLGHRASYIQTGGVATIGTKLNSNGTTSVVAGANIDASFVEFTRSSNANNGTIAFVVSGDAQMNLWGGGFKVVDAGTTWALTAENWDVSGTLKFSPHANYTLQEQNLLAFSTDMGEDAQGYTNNFAYGTLDLTDLIAAGKVLKIVAAGNTETTNAVYVQSLITGLGGEMAAMDDAFAHINSSLNVYYDPTTSDIEGNFTLAGGGSLIAVVIPEPASAALLLAGGALLIARRRSAARA